MTLLVLTPIDPKPDPPAHRSKTLEVPYFIQPPHQGIVDASIEFSTVREFVGAKAILKTNKRTLC